MLALIPLGRAFDAVRLADAIVHRAVGSDDSCVAGDRLAQYLGDGPVMHDPKFHRYYVLVPPGTAETWGTPVAECLGEGVYLGVPRVERTEPDEHPQAPYWVLPMTRPGHLCKPDDVLALAVAGGGVTGEDVL
ncbi:hypothetical protein ABZ568_37415 [Streptomyces olindensis]|uniref:Uncharacterized protein n=1 Tax=Streptomyces olindensis TaxID=358823 RepID=A0ABV2Y6Y2_9ACTN